MTRRVFGLAAFPAPSAGLGDARAQAVETLENRTRLGD